MPSISTYGVTLGLGHFLAGLFLLALAKREGEPLSLELDRLLIVLPAALLGARLGYAFTHWDEFAPSLLSLLSPAQGGFSLSGGLFAAGLAFFAIHRWQKKPLLVSADRWALAFAPAVAIFRWGCFWEGCCYGLPTSLPWGVRYGAENPHLPAEYVGLTLHPTQLYELSFLVLLTTALFVLRQKGRLRPGALAITTIAAYSLYRLLTDPLRGDVVGVGGFPYLTLLQGAATVCLVTVWFYRSKRASPQL